jgi:6-pyruvoyltetrahydropterin/6-carboxytetrahydropterin synthase
MTTTTIAKRFTFDAAHFLPTVPEHHKCRRMHGHTYEVELRFTGPTANNGFCAGIDYGDIAAVWARLHERVDHRTLNDVAGLEVPSTENLVNWIWTEFVRECGVEHAKLAAHFSGVRVAESSTTWCELRFTDGQERVIA